jgi:hypothetical protein
MNIDYFQGPLKSLLSPSSKEGTCGSDIFYKIPQQLIAAADCSLLAIKSGSVGFGYWFAS